MYTRQAQADKTTQPKRIACLAYFISGVIIYTIARVLCFYNSDENNLLTGSLYCLNHAAPWSVAWPLADCLLARLIPFLGNAFNSITMAGALLSGVGSAVTGITIARLTRRYSLATCSALLTGLWLVSPSGGWIVDALSYGIGLAPAFWATNHREDQHRWSIAAIAGCCLALGVVLKWNSFAPAYACTIAYLLINVDRRQRTTTKHLLSTMAIFSGAALVTSLACAALLDSLEIYHQTIGFYINLRNAPVEKGFAAASAWGKFSFPFNLDFFGALKQKRPGDLYFLPVWITYWAALIGGFALLRKNPSSESLKFGVFLLVSTGLAGCTLGRGMNQRLFLMPVGLLLIAENLNNPALRKKLIGTINFYFACGWLVLSLQQALTSSGIDARAHWHESLSDDANRQLCIMNKTLMIRPSNLSGIGDQNHASQCFDRLYITKNFSAMGLMSIPNQLGISIKEASPRTAPLREQWNSNTASHSGRMQLADNIIDQIRSNQSSYLLESYSSAIASDELPASWQEGRREIFTVIQRKLRLQYVGNQSGQILWKIGEGLPSASSHQT